MTEVNINERILRVRGDVNINEKLEITQDYNLMITANIHSQTLRDNQDGTFNLVYQMKPVTLDVIDKTGKKIPTKDKGGFSSKWRKFVWQMGLDYDTFVEKQWQYREEIIEFIKGLE